MIYYILCITASTVYHVWYVLTSSLLGNQFLEVVLVQLKPHWWLFLSGFLAAWLFLQLHREQAQQSTGKDGAHPNSYGAISWHLLLGRQEKGKGKSCSTQTPKGICKCWWEREREKMKERQKTSLIVWRYNYITFTHACMFVSVCIMNPVNFMWLFCRCFAIRPQTSDLQND